MSIHRSPQGNKTPVGPGGSRSQPDLSKPIEYDVDNQITFRKRKQPNCDCECDQVISALQAFRADMVSVLETNLKPMRDDLSAMKYQINDIKSSTEKLLAEHRNMKINSRKPVLLRSQKYHLSKPRLKNLSPHQLCSVSLKYY